MRRKRTHRTQTPHAQHTALPTACLPGTQAKLATLIERAEQGLPLHAPGDVLSDPARVQQIRRTRNGRDKVLGEEPRRPGNGEKSSEVGRLSDGKRKLLPSLERQSRLAERARQLRLLRGLTLGQAAQVSGLSASRIHAIESGATPSPTFLTVWALADALRVTMDELVGREAFDDIED